MVVLIAKSTWIEMWLSIDLHVKWFHWSINVPKILQKFAKPLDILVHVNGFNRSMTFPKKILKLPKELKQNVNWNQTLLNEVDLSVKWSWSHQFLFFREGLLSILTATHQHALLKSKGVFILNFLTRIIGNAGVITLPWLSFHVRNKRITRFLWEN